MDQQATTGQQQVGQRNKPRGRPFPPGVSGNPLGPHAVVKERVEALVGQWVADFPELTAIERSLLQQAAQLLVRAERIKDHDVAVRASNSAARLLASLRKKRSKPGRPPLRERLAAELAGE
jgi:hypothetical protein